MVRAVSGRTRDAEVRAAINAVVDPCSAAMTVPIGLDDLGIVENVHVDDGHVRVSLLPTSPHCLFLGLFEEEIESRVGALEWVRSVDVRLSESLAIWDESHLSDGARRRLTAARRRDAAAPRTPLSTT